MAKRTITMYTCDICGISSEHHYSFTTIKLPVLENKKFEMWECDSGDKSDICDCCIECANKIATTIAQTFGYYDLDEDIIVTP